MKAYPCIGGPLDGQLATTKDFQRPYVSLNTATTNYSTAKPVTFPVPSIHHPSGKYEAYIGQYRRFNSGRRGQKCSMIWVHTSLLRDPVSVGK